MAAAVRNTTTANTGGSTASSLAITLPTTVGGDTLLCFVSVDGGTGVTVTPPAGWTSINSNNNTTAVHCELFFRIADGSEPASLTFNFDIARMAAITMSSCSGTYYFVPSSTTNAPVAGTSITATSARNTAENGMIMAFYASRNTVGTNTWTSTATYSITGDTTTTATPFIGAMTQNHTAQGPPMTGTAVGAATATQTVTTANITVFLDDAHTSQAVLMDRYTLNAISASAPNIIMNGFQVNAPGLVMAMVEIGQSTQTVSSISYGGLTWVLNTRANAAAGSCELWTAWATAPVASANMTVTFSANTVSSRVYGLSISSASLAGAANFGAGSIGAVNTGVFAAVAPTINVTTTQSNSMVFGFANFSNVNSTGTAPANLVKFGQLGDATNVTGCAFARTAQLPNKSTVATINFTAPTTATGNILAWEVLPLGSPQGLNNFMGLDVTDGISTTEKIK